MKRTMLIIMALVLMASAANAQIVLWDQTAGYESFSQGFFNVIGGFGPMGMAMYSCNDIVVPASGWTVDSIKTYYDSLDQGWAGSVTTAHLFFEPKVGPLPTGDPTVTATVPVTVTLLPNNFLEVHASGLNLVINEGEYWIGLTPNAPSADNIHAGVANVGDPSPTYDANGFPMPMWTNWAADLDAALLIEGLDAVATESVSMGSVKALYR